VGAVLAWLLIHVINRRAFGWSMDALLPAPVFAEGLVLALAAALLAGVYPAIRMARARPAESLREE
jgi:putative ABC transport system permease protein